MRSYSYKVGELYNPQRRQWPEGHNLRLSTAGAELVLFLLRPTSREVQEIRRGTAAYALVTGRRVAVLAFRYGSLPWSDQPYEVWRERDDERGELPGEPGQRLLLHTVLVDAATGIIRAQRAATMSPEMSDRLRGMVCAQLAIPHDRAEALSELASLYGQYPSSDAFAAAAAVRCLGGE